METLDKAFCFKKSVVAQEFAFQQAFTCPGDADAGNAQRPPGQEGLVSQGVINGFNSPICINGDFREVKSITKDLVFSFLHN